MLNLPVLTRLKGLLQGWVDQLLMDAASQQMFVASGAVAELSVDAYSVDLVVDAVHRLLFVVEDLGEIVKVYDVECVDASGVELGGAVQFPSIASFQRSSDL